MAKLMVCCIKKSVVADVIQNTIRCIDGSTILTLEAREEGGCGEGIFVHINDGKTMNSGVLVPFDTFASAMKALIMDKIGKEKIEGTK